MCSKKIEAQSKKRTGQSKIQKNLLVEQKTGGSVVLSTPLLELPIQRTLEKAENHNCKCFTWNIFAPTIEKRWLGVAPTHTSWVITLAFFAPGVVVLSCWAGLVMLSLSKHLPRDRAALSHWACRRVFRSLIPERRSFASLRMTKRALATLLWV